MAVEDSTGHRRRLVAHLQAFYVAAGKPDHGTIARRAAERLPRSRNQPISNKRISEWLRGDKVPEDGEALWAIVSFLVEHREAIQADSPHTANTITERMLTTMRVELERMRVLAFNEPKSRMTKDPPEIATGNAEPPRRWMHRSRDLGATAVIVTSLMIVGIVWQNTHSSENGGPGSSIQGAEVTTRFTDDDCDRWWPQPGQPTYQWLYRACIKPDQGNETWNAATQLKNISSSEQSVSVYFSVISVARKGGANRSLIQETLASQEVRPGATATIQMSSFSHPGPAECIWLQSAPLITPKQRWSDSPMRLADGNLCGAGGVFISAPPAAPEAQWVIGHGPFELSTDCGAWTTTPAGPEQRIMYRSCARRQDIDMAVAGVQLRSSDGSVMAVPEVAVVTCTGGPPTGPPACTAVERSDPRFPRRLSPPRAQQVSTTLMTYYAISPVPWGPRRCHGSEVWLKNRHASRPAYSPLVWPGEPACVSPSWWKPQ